MFAAATNMIYVLGTACTELQLITVSQCYYPNTAFAGLAPTALSLYLIEAIPQNWQNIDPLSQKCSMRLGHNFMG